MEEVIKIFNEIKNTPSINEKQSIIEKHKDNGLFKFCLNYLLDKHFVTGIKEKKIYKKYSEPSTIEFWGLPDVIAYLKIHNTGTDEDIINIQNFIFSQPVETQEFYIGMITKTLKIGCDAKIVNKVIPNLIPTFDVMLGTPIDKCNIPEGTWFSVSQKLNGNRCIYYEGNLYTRQGKLYTGLQHIIEDIYALKLSEKFVIDGELLYRNAENLSDSDAFQKGTGIAQSKDIDKSDLYLVVFDIIPKAEFNTGIGTTPYSERYLNLCLLKQEIERKHLQNIKAVDVFYQGDDQKKIWEYLDYAEEHDMEGVMLNLNTPYECKRTKNLIKVKKFKECDIKCVHIVEGTGRNKGRLGALICDYKGNPVNVGSGFTDEDRLTYWEHPEKILNKICTIKYKEETKNKNGGTSIQFPVFVCVRFDKNEESYN